MNELEYYIIDRKGDKAYPLVGPNEDSEHTIEYIGDNFSKYYQNPIPDPEPMKFVFSDPIPRKPVIGDYFAEPESIVSKRFADVLLNMNIEGIQLIPATVKSNKGEIYEDFYFIYIHHYIEAMDKERSDFKRRPSGVYSIDSFKLNEKVLKKIPLEERLVFKLNEDRTMSLYHRSVVDAIMATEPKGVMFTKVEDWVL